jgi:hypothetical protein
LQAVDGAAIARAAAGARKVAHQVGHVLLGIDALSSSSPNATQVRDTALARAPDSGPPRWAARHWPTVA